MKETPEQLLREIRKLEARLGEFLKENDRFVEGVRSCLKKLNDLNSSIENLKATHDPAKLEELKGLRLEATKALAEVLKEESEVEHEKSHLTESYGALILAVEEGDILE